MDFQAEAERLELLNDARLPVLYAKGMPQIDFGYHLLRNYLEFLLGKNVGEARCRHQQWVSEQLDLVDQELRRQELLRP